jgi:hypothetical protein
VLRSGWVMMYIVGQSIVFLDSFNVDMKE